MPRSAEALTNCTVAQDDLNYDAEEKNFLVVLNQYRAQNGAPPLTPSANLNRSAAWMARNNADRTDTPSHYDTLGRDPVVRMQDCDAIAPGGAIAENIAGGPSATGAEILVQWQHSPPHDATMKRADLKQIGIARAYNAANQFPWEWVTNFSTVDDGTNISGPVSHPAMNIESPGTSNVTSTFQVTGWAIDTAATADTGIDNVHVYVYPSDSNSNVTGGPAFFSPASYGGRRDDLANYFGPQFLNSGFSVQTTALPPGLYLIVVYEHSKIADTWTPVTRLVSVPGS
jgi:hypothetical protein